MAIIVINQLEMVDIQHDQRKITTLATAALQLFIKRFHHVTAIKESGQVIGVGKFQQQFV